MTFVFCNFYLSNFFTNIFHIEIHRDSIKTLMCVKTCLSSLSVFFAFFMF